jgi:XTP/dITP diphosphohydrolase
MPETKINKPLSAGLIIATNNADKAEEIRTAFKGFFENVKTLKDAGIFVEPDENGSTFFENAYIKAKAASQFTGLPVLADDSGLCVDALNGGPGVFSARYAGVRAVNGSIAAGVFSEHGEGVKLGYNANNERLMQELDGVAPADRTARYVCNMVLFFKDGSYISAEGRAEGLIIEAPLGENGFGYDPYFYSPELKKTFAQASPLEKNSVSHRARAAKALLSEHKKLHGGAFEKDESEI